MGVQYSTVSGDPDRSDNDFVPAVKALTDSTAAAVLELEFQYSLSPKPCEINIHKLQSDKSDDCRSDLLYYGWVSVDMLSILAMARSWYSEVMDSIPPTRIKQELKKPRATHMTVHWERLPDRPCAAHKPVQLPTNYRHRILNIGLLF